MNRKSVTQPDFAASRAVQALSDDGQKGGGVHVREFIPPIRLQSTAIGNSAQRRLIVYAYFRSGSTLTGQLFNYNPTSFYWYEPLAGVTEQFGFGGGKLQPRNYFHFDNGTEKCVRLMLGIHKLN